MTLIEDRRIVNYFFDSQYNSILTHVSHRSGDKPGVMLMVEEFLSNRHFIEYDYDTTHQREVTLSPWAVELNVLAKYLELLREISALVRFQGDNHLVFGRPNAQELLVDMGARYEGKNDKRTRIRVGLRVTNPSMVKALGESTVGLCWKGDVVKSGTLTTFSSLLSLINERVEQVASMLPEAAREPLRTQWEVATESFVTLNKEHFGIHHYGSEENLLNAGRACALLSISSTTLNRYRGGMVPAGYAPFPPPDKYHGRSALWYRQTLKNWTASRK